MTTTNRNALLATPDVPWASDAIELVFTQESRSVANHSARSWIFARMLRDHLNLTHEVDETLLFAATLLHDIGLRRDAREPVRFEIDGADRAAEFLTAHGAAAPFTLGPLSDRFNSVDGPLDPLDHIELVTDIIVSGVRIAQPC